MPEISGIASQIPRQADPKQKLDEFGNVKPTGVKVVRRSNDVLGKDSFLKLLVKQLSTQNPLEPVNDREFIAQMAQFSALEQMNNMSKTMDKVSATIESLKSFQANNLVGKYIAGKDMVSGRLVKGRVDSLLYDSKGEAILRVNGRSVRTNDIISISADSPDTRINVSRETNQKQATTQYNKNIQRQDTNRR